LGNKKITLEDLINVTRRGYKVKISDEAYEKIDKARKLVDKYVEEGKVSYGITTGFGKFAEVSISKEQTGQLQKNIVMSHSCSVGNPLPIDIARGVVLLRAVNLAKGYSGARRIVVEKLVELLNKEVTPWIPEKGSVGSSGDLSPLAHMSLVLIGLGKAYYKGELLEAKDALAKAGIEPIPSLSSKEGLALTNGTQALTSTGAHVLYDAINLSKHLDIAASLTMESLHGIIDAYDPRISEVREHTGQINTAENMRKILAGSKNVTKQGVERVQDSYVLRCIPQIHGASKDTLEYVKRKVEIESENSNDPNFDRIRSFMKEFIVNSKLSLKIVNISKEGERYVVNVDGKDIRYLIGEKGSSLNAIEYLLTSVKTLKNIKVVIDSNNYKEKREEALRDLARKKGKKVLDSGRNVKLNPDLIENLIDKKHFFPAYHMNKKYWITILLDSDTDLNLVKSLIDESFKLVEK